MPSTDYFVSITQEVTSLKNRVRHLIQGSHWLTDGEWKESVIRTMLRRHLPKQYGVGRGFILADAKRSTQVDVLIYDTSKPILHQDGELVIVTTDAVCGVIEVKTKLTRASMDETVDKLVDNIEFVNGRHGYENRVYGLFAYEIDGIEPEQFLAKINNSALGSRYRRLNCACLGLSHFVRYWDCIPPGPPPKKPNVWRAYQVENMAPAYFLHNIFEHLCAESVLTNNSLWFPLEGKEQHRICELEFVANETRP
jgi:hypothetical protein